MEELAEMLEPQRLGERIAFHKRIIDEEDAAALICKRALVGPAAWWRNRLRQEKDFATAGMVEELLKRYSEAVPRSPAEAFVLTELAIEIAGSIAVTDYPYDHVLRIRGQALRGHAFLLSFTGRFHEAMAEANHAEKLLKQIPVPNLELARLNLVRANIARCLDKYPDALRYARRAAETFKTFGDRQGWIKARQYEAATLTDCRDNEAALAVWRELEKTTRELAPRQMAAVLNNIGLCLQDSGSADEAIVYHTRADRILTRLDLPVDRAKCRHNLALALAAAGKHQRAVTLFRKAWKELETLGLESDAALTALRLAELLLVQKREPEVAKICRRLLDRFNRAGMMRPALIALAFLREALASGVATPMHVRHVHDFLHEKHGGKQPDFVPLLQ